VNAEVHTFVVDDPQMIENHTELKRLSKLMHDVGYMQYTKFVLPDVEEEERCSICVTIVRNWLLHVGSSTKLLDFTPNNKKCEFAKIATHPRHSFQK
jgi:hypothetical protein